MDVVCSNCAKNYGETSYEFCLECGSRLIDQSGIPTVEMQTRKLSIPMSNTRAGDIEFTEIELRAYQTFATFISEYVTKITKKTTYIKDPLIVLLKLQKVYDSSLLETEVQNRGKVIWCLLSGGSFQPNSKTKLQVAELKNFIKLLKSQNKRKISIVLSNLWMRLDAIPRYVPDEIPF